MQEYMSASNDGKTMSTAIYSYYACYFDDSYYYY